MADAIDNQVIAAFKAKWEAVGLGTGIPGGLHQEPIPDRPPHPYAAIDSRASAKRTRDFSTGRQWIDFRDVTMQVYHTDRELLGTKIRTVLDAFDDQPLSTLAGFMRCEPMEPEKIEPTKQQAEGQDVWRATLQWIVWTHQSR